MLRVRKERRLPPKTFWVTYGLQKLSTEKFLKVVQGILDGEYILLGANEPDFDDIDLGGEIFTTDN